MKHHYWVWMLALPALVHAEEGSDAGPRIDMRAGAPQAAFNNDTYRLVFDVYVGHHDLAAAYQVASKAVQNRPRDPLWLRRYAQAAEWIGQPANALQAWMKLAQITDSKEAWSAVGRLAPSLLNDEAVLAYQKKVISTQGVNPLLLESVTSTHERLGRLDEGLSYLEQLAKSAKGPEVQDMEARLCERMGKDDKALALLGGLINRYGPREDWLMRIVGLRYSHGDVQESWKVLKAVEPRMPKTAAGYWQTYAELSSQLEHREEAERAYKVLLAQDKASMSDMSNYVALIQDEDGLAAAYLSEQLFRKYGDDGSMINALYLYQRENNPAAAVAMLKKLDKQQLAHLEHNADFLSLRGQLYWRQRQYVQAHNDFEHGLRIEPGNISMLQNLVNLVAEQRDDTALRRLLLQYQQRAMAEPALWTTWAGGWNALGQPDRALPFLQSYCRAHPDDDLGRLSLADTLDKMGDNDRARAIRRQVLATANGGRGNKDPKALQDALLAVRLDQAAPDPGLLMLRQRLQHEAASGLVDPATRDLAINWLLAHGGEQQAQSWVARHNRMARATGRGSMTEVGDSVIMQQVALSTSESMTDVEREDLAQQFDWPQLGMAGTEVNDEQAGEEADAQQQYRERLVNHAGWLGVDADILQVSGLQRSRAGVIGAAPIGELWRIEGQVDHISQSSQDAALLGKPKSGGQEQLRLVRQDSDNTWLFELRNTRLAEDYVGAAIGQEYHPPQGLNVHWRADFNADAPESAALLAAGMKDQIGAGFNWPLPQRWFIGGDISGANFYGQKRESLGSGGELELEGGRNFKLMSVPQALKVVGVVTDFHADSGTLPADLATLVPAGQAATPAFFVPKSYHQIGAYWDVGEAPSSVYQPHWQGFGEFGPTYASTSGSGYEARAGLHGPVVGHDNLVFSVEQSKSGMNNGGVFKRALLTYRYLF